MVCLTAVNTVHAQRSTPSDLSRPPSRNTEIADGSDVFRAAPAIVIDSSEIAASGARTLSELLIARVAGLSVVRSSGSATGNSLIRLRGVHSILGPSSPVIIVDGVRVAANQRTSVISPDIVQPSELDDIALDDVAQVEVRAGAAAGAMAGPDAGDGIITVTTKSGGRGPLVATARARASVTFAKRDWPLNYRLNGISNSNGQPVSPCLLWRAADGNCTPTTLTTTNPLVQVSPFRLGRTATAHTSAAGGFGVTTFYVSGATDWDGGTVSNDAVSRFGGHARITQRLPGALVVSAVGSIQHKNETLPDAGAWLSTNVIAAGLFGSGVNDSLHGYLHAPYSLDPHRRVANVSRASVTMRWEPAAWFAASSTYGRDRVAADETLSPMRLSGQATHLLDGVRTFTATLTTRYPLRFHLTGETRLALQRVQSERFTRDSIFGNGFFGLDLRGVRSETGGVAVAEELTWQDRLTADGILWRGRAMTINGDPATEYYPAVLLAWRVGDLGNRGALRLHASYGESGSGSMDLTTAVFTVQPYWVTFPQPVMDERTIERAVGFDAAIGRLTIRVDRFRSASGHLFIPVPASCATGTCPKGILDGASVSNAGTELTVNSTLMDRRRVQWEASLVASTLQNRLTHLPSPPFYIGSQYYSQGYPLAALWGESYAYADANGDHVLGSNEVRLTSTPRYLGSSAPSLEAGVISQLAVAGVVSSFIHLDYRGGQRRPNINEQIRCSAAFNCRGLMDSTASLAEQAAAIWAGGELVNAYVEDARFLRLHALGVSWRLPAWSARWVGRASTLSLTGFDLLTWTAYKGLDPEVSTWTAGGVPTYDLARTPILRRVELRLDVSE